MNTVISVKIDKEVKDKFNQMLREKFALEKIKIHQKFIIAEREKLNFVYENQNYLFFILAPVRTRTFKNEKPALDLAEKIKYLLEEHNKMFNQKIEFEK